METDTVLLSLMEMLVNLYKGELERDQTETRGSVSFIGLFMTLSHERQPLLGG